jgi:hypothetical protein
LQHSLIAKLAKSYEDQILIRLLGESWEDVNWDSEGYRTVNQELGMFCCLLYPGMVTVAGRWIAAAARFWTQWVLKPYVD